MEENLSECDRCWTELPCEMWRYIFSFYSFTNFPRCQLSLTCSYLRNIVESMPDPLKTFSKYLTNVSSYSRLDMLGIKDRMRTESGIRFSELYYLEMIVEWSSHARPERKDLWKVGRSILTANIGAVLLNCVSRHIRSLFEDYGLWKWPTEFRYDGTDVESIHHYWDLREAQMTELVVHKKLRLGSNIQKVVQDIHHLYEDWVRLEQLSEQRSNARSCLLHRKYWKLYENPSFQLELHNGNYWVRNLTQSECQPDEHFHENTILHTWFETVTENSGSDAMFKLKLIDQIKAENQADAAPILTSAEVLHSYFSPLSSDKLKLEEVFTASKAGLRVHILIQGNDWG